MAIFVRNFHTPYYTPNGGSITLAWYYGELLRLAGYTYDSDDGDPGWASSLNVFFDEPGSNGLIVDPNEPLIVTDPLSRFTQAMVDAEASIVLRAGNDQNKGAWRMVDFISTSKVRIDNDGRPAYGWTPETGIPARVTIPNGLPIGDGSWIIYNAPAPSRLQVRILKTLYNNVTLQVRPEGQPLPGQGDDINVAGTPTIQLTAASGLFRVNMIGRNITITGAVNPTNNGTFPITGHLSSTVIQYTNALAVAEGPVGNFSWSIDGDPTETGAQTIGRYPAVRTRINMTADGPNVLLFAFGGTYEDFTLLGELASTETEDEHPGFLYGPPTTLLEISFPWFYQARMLSHTVSQILGYPTFLKNGWDVQDQVQWNARAGRRLVNGYAFGRSPWIAMADEADGGYVRGRFPLVVFTSTAFVPYQPLDGSGQWQHLINGLGVPRNGPNDPLIIPSESTGA